MEVEGTGSPREARVIAPLRWGAGARAPRLAERGVWLATADLDDRAWDASSLGALLSADELERAGRLATEELWRRFVVRRGLLRQILGSALGRQPASLRLRAGERGKPELEAEEGAPRLHFNMADCGPRAIYGLTYAGPLGVDIEALAPAPDLPQVARRWFSAAEQAALARLAPDRWLLGFYQCWTRKEALVKAAGGGVAMGLDRFTVSLGPGDPALLVQSDLADLRGFELLEVAADAPYVAACAVRRCRVSFGG